MPQLVPFYFVNEITFTFIIAIKIARCDFLFRHILQREFKLVILNRSLVNRPTTLGLRGLNNINNRKYSTLNKSSLYTTILPNNNDKLENSYISGFCDADSSFTVSVLRKSNMKIG
jgi:hypothetical protein